MAELGLEFATQLDLQSDVDCAVEPGIGLIKYIANCEKG